MVERLELRALGQIPSRIGAKFVQPQLHGLEIARKVLQLRIGCVHHEPFAHQALKLVLQLLDHLRLTLGVLDFALHLGKFGQHGATQARHFLRDQIQSAASFLQTLLKCRLAIGQGVKEEGPIQ